MLLTGIKVTEGQERKSRKTHMVSFIILFKYFNYTSYTTVLPFAVLINDLICGIPQDCRCIQYKNVMLGQETVIKVTVHFSITGITEKMFKLKPREMIVEKAKKYMLLRTVAVKKSKKKRAAPPAEASENLGEEDSLIYNDLLTKFSSTKYIVI